MRAELERAELRLINWHEVFPTVDVMEVRILLNPLRGVEVPNVGEEQIQAPILSNKNTSGCVHISVTLKCYKNQHMSSLPS